MAQTSKISRNNTTKTVNNDYRAVTLHNTVIFEARRIDGVTWRITVRHGGHTTVTTATRLRQIANEWHVPFGVSRAGGQFQVWRLVRIGDTCNHVEIAPTPHGYGTHRDEYVFDCELAW